MGGLGGLEGLASLEWLESLDIEHSLEQKFRARTLDRKDGSADSRGHPFSIIFATFSEDRLFDAFWSPFGSLWLPFGSLWLPFGSLLAPFGSLLATFWLPLPPHCSL